MWQIVEKRNIITDWFLWHYVTALKDIFLKWKNILRFNLDYFSIPFLLETLFSPWRRYKISYGRGFDIGRFAEAIFFNAFSRFMGMIVRFSVICIGVVLQIFVFIIGFFVFLFWIALPFLILIGGVVSLIWIISI